MAEPYRGDQVSPAQWKWVIGLFLLPTLGGIFGLGAAFSQIADNKEDIGNTKQIQEVVRAETSSIKADVSALQSEVKHLNRSMERSYLIQQKILDRVSK